MATVLTAPQVVERVVQAHGGMGAWQSAPAVSYEHVLVLLDQPDDPWSSRETIERGGRRFIQEWPLEGARIVCDGSRIWSSGWRRPVPPRRLANRVYCLVSLPWLAQGQEVQLEGLSTGRIPGDPRELLRVRIAFPVGTEMCPSGEYVLFVDPALFLTRATAVAASEVGFPLGARPRATATEAKPVVHVYDRYETVDGLQVPVWFRTLDPEGNVRGIHEVRKWSFRKLLDESRLVLPAGARVDLEDPDSRGGARGRQP